MKNKGVEIIYDSEAYGARESFDGTSNSFTDFSSRPSTLFCDDSFKNYGNPNETYSVLLDGNCAVIPKDKSKILFGLWSKDPCNGYGEFDDPPTLTIYSTLLNTSGGITIEFDNDNNIYPSDVTIEWFADDELLSEKSYKCTEATFYFENKVKSYNKVVFSFSSLNMKYVRLRIRSINIGTRIVFSANMLKEVTIMQNLDPISSAICINTLDFSIRGTGVEYIDYLGRLQKVRCFFDGELVQQSYISSFSKDTRYSYSVRTEDIVSVLDSLKFIGGLYKNKKVGTLVSEILGNIPYSIDDGIANEIVTGYLPVCTAREALMQVLFATCSVASTAFSEKINIFKLKDEITHEVPKANTLDGQKETYEDAIKSVSIASHSYSKSDEEMTLYNAKDDGIGNNIYVEFTEPVHDISITDGVILDVGVNYARFNANSSQCLLVGKKYNHVERIFEKKNDMVAYNDLYQAVEIKDATLISAENIDKVLETCYNYYMNKRKFVSKFVDRKNALKVGDLMQFETSYSGSITGRIENAKFSLLGGTIVKECTTT